MCTPFALVNFIVNCAMVKFRRKDLASAASLHQIYVPMTDELAAA